MRTTVHQAWVPDLSNEPFAAGDWIELGAEESQHLLKALRVREGEPVRVFDGSGRFADGVLGRGSRRCAGIQVRVRGRMEKPGERILGLGLLKGKALDEAVRTATVLGVTRIFFLDTKQGDVRFEDRGRERARIDGLRRTAIEACKQSGRLHLPEFAGVGDPGAFLENLGVGGVRMVASLRDGSRPVVELVEGNADGDRIAIAIGPAGDFTEDEYDQLEAGGFCPVSLGQVVLKAEMAVAYGFSVLDACLQRTDGQTR